MEILKAFKEIVEATRLYSKWALVVAAIIAIAFAGKPLARTQTSALLFFALAGLIVTAIVWHLVHIKRPLPRGLVRTMGFTLATGAWLFVASSAVQFIRDAVISRIVSSKRYNSLPSTIVFINRGIALRDVNLRRIPSLGANIVTVIERNGIFEVIRDEGKWIEVVYKGHRGWVKKVPANIKLLNRR